MLYFSCLVALRWPVCIELLSLSLVITSTPADNLKLTVLHAQRPYCANDCCEQTAHTLAMVGENAYRALVDPGDMRYDDIQLTGGVMTLRYISSQLLSQSIIPEFIIALIIRLRVWFFFAFLGKSKNSGLDANHQLQPVNPKAELQNLCQLRTHTDHTQQLPYAFYNLLLAEQPLFSPGYWDSETEDPSQANLAMLALQLRRCGVQPGEKICDLAAGWGEFAIYCAREMPTVQVTAIVSTGAQRAHIDRICTQKKLTNLQVIALQLQDFRPDTAFDRLIGIELYASITNPYLLADKLRSWLRPNGQVFLQSHVLQRLQHPIHLASKAHWVLAPFIGQKSMLPQDHLQTLNADFQQIDCWQLPVSHTLRSIDIWLKRLHRQRVAILRIFFSNACPSSPRLLWRQWQIFLLAWRYGMQQSFQPWHIQQSLLQLRPAAKM